MSLATPTPAQPSLTPTHTLHLAHVVTLSLSLSLSLSLLSGWGARKHIVPVGDMEPAQVAAKLQELVETGDAIFAADPSTGHTYDMKAVVV